MARYGCTITVALGKSPSAVLNLPWIAVADNFPSEAIDGGLTSILNGGGNLRCYLDGTKSIQLPVEVVDFVTGVAPQIIIWGLSPLIVDLATVYIEADTVATAQPAVSAPFGRNSVWANYFYSTHDGVTDSTGNHAISQVGGPTAGVNPWGGESVLLASGQYGRAAISSTNNDDTLAFSFWQKPAGAGNRSALGVFSSSANADYMSNQGNLAGFNYFHRRRGNNPTSRPFSTTSSVIGQWSKVDSVNRSNSLRSIYFNGGGRVDNTVSVSSSVSLNRLTYGRVDDGTPSGSFVGELAELRVIKASPTNEVISTEWENQSDPASFWTTSAWEDQEGGGTITITESVSTLNITTQNPAIEFTGAISVEESTVTLSTTSQSPTITFTAALTIEESTQALSLTGLGPTITLSGTITIEESTQTIDMLTRSPVIQLGIPTYATVFTGTVKSYSFTGTITPTQTFSGTEKAATFLGVQK